MRRLGMAAAMSQDMDTVVRSLKGNHFSPVEFVEKADNATQVVLDMIPLEATVGFAGSMSVTQIRVFSPLRKRGARLIGLAAPSRSPREELMRQDLCADVLLTSSNAVTLDGKLVNIDGTGNRVAGMIFGPKKVILVIGMNKIVRDVHGAIDRIKNVIAPYHAMTIGKKTPCATELRCTDCRSPERICNVTTIIERKPSSSDIAIVLVGEDLGLGWDPDWPEDRKERIASVYQRQMERIGLR
jgi:hypothetical protein